MMAIIVPYLLTNGLGSAAEDVRLFSAQTLLTICGSGKELLKPHISAIVPVLIEFLSISEPAALNYLQFHTDAYKVTQKQVSIAAVDFLLL